MQKFILNLSEVRRDKRFVPISAEGEVPCKKPRFSNRSLRYLSGTAQRRFPPSARNLMVKFKIDSSKRESPSLMFRRSGLQRELSSFETSGEVCQICHEGRQKYIDGRSRQIEENRNREKEEIGRCSEPYYSREFYEGYHIPEPWVGYAPSHQNDSFPSLVEELGMESSTSSSSELSDDVLQLPPNMLLDFNEFELFDSSTFTNEEFISL